MQVKRIVTDYYAQNAYVLLKNNEALIVDPGSSFEKIKAEIGSAKVLGVLVTHRHFDHIGALDEVVREYKVQVIDVQSKSKQKLSLFEFEIIRTPGHSSDSVTFYFPDEKLMFTGDFLFYRSIGRCDLETGDTKIMQESIEKIKKYPADTIIYPGHDRQSSLADEIENNPYF